MGTEIDPTPVTINIPLEPLYKKMNAEQPKDKAAIAEACLNCLVLPISETPANMARLKIVGGIIDIFEDIGKTLNYTSPPDHLEIKLSETQYKTLYDAFNSWSTWNPRGRAVVLHLKDSLGEPD